jgi:uncharacterized protein YkwD
VSRTTQGAADRTSRDLAGERVRLVSIASSPRREYSLDKARTTIGSHPSNDIVIDNTTVSRYHAAISRKSGEFDLADLSSTNGTFVNGTRVRKAVALQRGDEVKFGSVRFAFVNAGDPAPAATRAVRASGTLIRRLAILAVLFVLGFAGVRYRSEIATVASSAVALISSHRTNPAPIAAPSAIVTQPASVKTAGAPSVHAEAAVSTPAVAAAPAAAEPEWLKQMNYYRAMVKLPPVVEDAAASKGDREHAMYIVRNYRDAIFHNGLGAQMHTEDPGTPGFTPEGLEAAKSSDMDVWSNRGEPADAVWGSPDWSIDGWMALPFHRMPIINPALTSAGFGMYCEAGACAAGLNLLKGVQRKIPPDAAKSMPIEFPPEGGTVAMNSFDHEWPEPRTSCPGYEPPSGLAITIQLGNWLDTHLTEYSLARVSADGGHTQIDACGLDSTSYSNPDAYTQDLGRNVLKSYGTALIIPRAPLDKGAKYAVSMTVNGKQYDWTFAISP